MSASSTVTSMKWFPDPSEPSCSRQRAASAPGSNPAVAAGGLQRLDASRRRRREALVHAARRQRDRLLDGLPQRRQRPPPADLLRRPLRADGDHAAADVHADGGGDDRAQRRDDAADRRALAQVGVGHEGQVRVDEGEGGGRDCLGPGVLLEDRCPADQPRAEVLACHEAGAWHEFVGRRRRHSPDAHPPDLPRSARDRHRDAPGGPRRAGRRSAARLLVAPRRRRAPRRGDPRRGDVGRARVGRVRSRR